MLQRTEFVLLAVAGTLLVACAIALTLLSSQFTYEYAVPDMPVLVFVAVLAAAGAAYLLAAYATFRIAQTELATSGWTSALVLVVLCGGIARAVLAFSEPMLEDDYQRYLLDGAMTVAGHNPYAITPSGLEATTDPELKSLATSAGVVLLRINHPEIRTIYPPGAQVFFALAHLIKPFSLPAWRGVVMAADLATFALLLALLHTAGRPLIWSTLYWWNPIVIKELTNSVHMEAVLMPFILAAVWCAVRRRPWAATLFVAAAGAIKIWPLALFPILMRCASKRWAVWLGTMVLLGGITLLWVTPMVLAGLDQSAGVVAYAEKWRTNSAMFSTLLGIANLTGIPDLIGLSFNHVARGLILLIVFAAGLSLAVRRPENIEVAIQRIGLIVIVIFLVSPAQFPWYVVWISPFLAFLPLPGLLVLALTMPLYYVAFHLMSINAFPLFNNIVIWLVWCPVWALLIMQLLLQGPIRRGQTAATLTRHTG